MTRWLFGLACLLGALSLGPCGAVAEAISQWTQLGPDGALVARVVTDGSPCPKLTVDGSELALQQRAAPDAAFQTRVCEATLLPKAREATLEGRRFPLLPEEVRRIAVIGDTGCRIKGDSVQACDDPRDWPFAKVAGQIADREPDLVIHVGDYLYRETSCPAGADCQGSPHGDTGATWKADWFEPARALFAKAPLLLVRGNHEQCGRDDKGWLRYLAVRPMPSQCPQVEEVWTAQLSGLTLTVFDSSPGIDVGTDAAYGGVLRQMAEKAFSKLDGRTWVLTHRPLWAYIDPYGPNGDPTQRDAFADLMGREMSLVLSGHIHSFQLSDMETGPSQVIGGNSGTKLDPVSNVVLHDVVVGTVEARSVVNDAGFGFLMFERQNDGVWRFTVYDADGGQRHVCRVEEQNIYCDGERAQ